VSERGTPDRREQRAPGEVPPAVDLPAPWRQAQWRRLDPRADAELVYRWMHAPHVAPYWQLAVPRRQLAGYLAAAVGDPDRDVLLGLVDGEPVSYWETYWAQRDRLAAFCLTLPWDQGVHLLIGPPALVGRGLGRHLLAAVARWQLDREPRTGRLLAEPDLGNARSIRLFERCGFRQEAELALPEKRAALMVRHRAEQP
jgi:acetyl CoA:N6-hydroxylysine acetyl transferase